MNLTYDEYPLGIMIFYYGFGPSGPIEFKYIHWHLLIKAPITNFMDQLEFFKYCELNGFNFDSTKDGHLFLVLYENILAVEMLFKDNCAGSKGECITWGEIKELYK